MSDSNPQFASFLAPRFWPTWLGLGLMRLLYLLPFSAQRGLGKFVGSLTYYVMTKRRRIADKNLSLCFPDWDQATKDEVIKENFKNLGQAIFETALTWWGSEKRLANLEEVEGLHHVTDALNQGKGVILLSAHFTTLEIGCRLLLLHVQFHAMYRSHDNPLFGEIMRKNRERLANVAIPKNEVRQLIRSLKSNNAVWYAPDQAYRGNNSILVPFFGVPAPTNPATSRLAKMTGAPVIPFFSERNEQTGKYHLKILPPIENFPTGDVAADAVTTNAIIEAQVRRAPEQYLWTHRRFKPLTAEHEDPYSD
ncbi:MAG: LpxL/LpxP family Kdo(2)-lipid IV(A) lauroyl/palmitoleoyl acyltransferase [Pseudomonadota bacterium]